MFNQPLSHLRFFVISIALLLSACTTLSDPILKTDTPDKWRNTLTKLDNEAAPKAAWWSSLKDPILDKSVELALKQNLSLAQALERLNAARASEKATLANQYPHVDFTAGPDNLARPTPESVIDAQSAKPEDSLRTTGAYIAGFDLIWELPIFGRGEGQRKVEKAAIASVEADIHTTRISISAEVVRTYGQLRAAQDRLHILDSLISHHQMLAALIVKGQQAGLFSDNEQDNSHTAITDLRNEELITLAHKESALQRLSVLCGLSSPLTDWLDLSSTPWILTHLAKPPSILPADLIRSRSDIHHAEAAVLQASGEAGIAHADLYPKLAIEGALMLVGNLSGATRTTQVITVLAPSVRIPLVDWGLAREVVNAREANLREAILAYREAVLLAIEDTENALSNFNASEERLVRTEKETEYIKAKSEKLESAFKAGYLSRPELLRMEIKLLEQESQLIDSKVSWIGDFAIANKSLSTMNASSTEIVTPSQNN